MLRQSIVLTRRRGQYCESTTASTLHSTPPRLSNRVQQHTLGAVDEDQVVGSIGNVNARARIVDGNAPVISARRQGDNDRRRSSRLYDIEVAIQRRHVHIPLVVRSQGISPKTESAAIQRIPQQSRARRLQKSLSQSGIDKRSRA